jgi:quercetin dioxygenase-like cupin family protein
VKGTGARNARPFLLVLALVVTARKETTVQLMPNQPSTKGPAEMFSGDAYFDVIARGEPPSRLRVNAVHFAPCARTAWHCHANGQTLHVTDGVGLVQARGGEVLETRPGDTIYTPPGEWHWHGATPDHQMTHLAMWESLSEDQDGPETTWGEPVSDQEYGAR